jgi:hypothetical protein
MHSITLIITPWFESASELYRPSDRRLLAKLVTTFAVRGCRVISATYIRTTSTIRETLLFSLIYEEYKSRGSAVDIATDYKLYDRGICVQVPVRKSFSLLHIVQTGCGPQLASYAMRTGGCIHGGKSAGA